MGAVITLALKDLRVLSRDRFALFWILAFPLMYALFFGSIFSSGGGGEGGAGLALAIVDEDGSDSSRALVARLAEHESVRLAFVGDTREPVLSSLEQARAMVRKGERTAYVRVPAGWGDDPWAMFAGGADGGPVLELGVDPSRQAEAGFLQGILMEVQFAGLSDRFGDKQALRADIAAGREEIAAADDLGAGQKLVLDTFMGALGVFLEGVDDDVFAQGPMGGDAFEKPFDVVDVDRERERGPRSAFEITFPQALVWGLMSVALSFAITIVRESTAGTLLRLRVAPVSRTQLLAGKALGCFSACVLVTLLLLVFGRFALDVRFDSLPLVALSTVSMSACFTGIMMAVSVLGRTEQAVAGASWGLMMPFAMLGGGMIPLVAMPEWLAKASYVSPFRWAIVSMEGAVWRGFELADMALPCAVLIGTGALSFAIGVRVFRRMHG